MTTIIEQAREVWEAKREKMTKEDWMLLADALIEGKAWCAEHKGYGGPRGFGKWCLEQGFGSVDARYRSDAVEVAQNHRDAFLSSDNLKINHPQAFLAGIRKQREIDANGHIGAQVAAYVAKNPDQTAEEIADGLGFDKEAIRKRTSSWVTRGLLKKEKGEDGAVRFQVGDGEPVSPGRTVEDRLMVEAARAGKPVPTHLLSQLAEDLYWLNLMLARELNDGSTLMPQTTSEEQAQKFQEWLDSFYKVTGRSVTLTKKVGGLALETKPFRTAPLRIELDMEIGDA